jgi:metal-responsive CopG/Arc/MetJ family transcriptional regulator
VKTISLKLPDQLLATLESAAKQRGETKSELVRAAVEHFLKGGHDNRPVSALELAGTSIGAAKGPPDLSTNRKHMKGYGR